jgi:hypothetical protein
MDSFLVQHGGGMGVNAGQSSFGRRIPGCDLI